MSIPRLNPFLGIETSHASSNFKAQPYLGSRSACSTALAMLPNLSLSKSWMEESEGKGAPSKTKEGF